MKEFLNEIGINLSIIIGGVIGGAIGRKKDKPIAQQMGTVFVAAIAANYIAPVVIEIFNLSENTLAGMGFLIGYTGMSMLDYLLDSFKKKIDKKVDPNNHY